MKRNKIIAVAVVVMMMVGAVVLMSCSKCPGDGGCKIDESDMIGSVKSWCFDGDFTDPKTRDQINECFGSWDGVSKATCDC